MNEEFQAQKLENQERPKTSTRPHVTAVSRRPHIDSSLSWWDKIFEVLSTKPKQD